MSKYSSCLDCKERHTRCHVSCKNYNNYRKQLENIKHARELDKTSKKICRNVESEEICKQNLGLYIISTIINFII